MLRVLLVTNMFPWEEDAYYGIFVKEQVEGLLKYKPVKFTVKFINGAKSALNYFLSIFSINYHLLLNNYDLVHIHYGFSGLFVLFNPFIRTPIVVTLHSGDIDPRKGKHFQIWVTKRVLKRAKHVIILNNEMGSIVRAYNRNSTRIPCGVNTDVFRPIDRANPQTDKDLFIVFPGARNRSAKNFPLFINVLKILEVKHHSQVKFAVLESMDRGEIAGLFNNVDCLLMTSYSEGSPQVIKEAMACNTNIVSTNVGDVQVLLENVNNAIVVDSYDPAKLANAVIECTIRETSKNGREQIFLQRLDEKSVSERVYQIYLQVLKEN